MINNRATSTLFMLLSVLCFSFFSFSVYAASETSSFIEFNIAFVLGLSLPVLLITFIGKSSSTMSKRYPMLLTLALLTLLYCLSYLPQQNDYIALTFSALVLQLSFFWSTQLDPSKEQDNISKVKCWQVLSYGLLLIAFLSVLWLGVVSAGSGWLYFCAVQILLYGASFIFPRNDRKNINRGVLLLLAVNVLFSIAVYTWLNGVLALNLLVATVVITYLVAMGNGCWQIISTLVNNPQVIDNKTAQIDSVIFDPSTNLPTYQYALKVFDYNLKHKRPSRYAAIVFKPTNFEQVNEILGHHNSDILLLQLAYCLQKSIESNNELLNFSSEESPVRIARLQGLHFLVVMDVAQNKYTDEVIIEQLCHQLAQAVPGPMSFKSFSLFFKLVFGVAFIGKDSNNVSEVITCAEDALLQADKQRKQVSFFAHELTVFNQQQLHKMEQLKQIILDDAIKWQIQPQINMASKVLLAFELLLTWQRQQDENLDFNEIMLLAQQSGDAYTLCRQMVKQAFIFLQQLHALGTKVQVSMKLSSCCLLEPDLIDYIEQQSLNYDIDCQYLLLEIQEEILLSVSQEAKNSIGQLKSLGVKISIDEFSGSYEALRYLRRMAVSEIKINCQALAQAEAGSSDKAIINALINLTRKMELPLIGTNINSIVIEEMFIAMGGEYAQGRHYCSSVNLQDLPCWLESWHQQYSV